MPGALRPEGRGHRQLMWDRLPGLASPRDCSTRRRLGRTCHPGHLCPRLVVYESREVSPPEHSGKVGCPRPPLTAHSTQLGRREVSSFLQTSEPARRSRSAVGEPRAELGEQPLQGPVAL